MAFRFETANERWSWYSQDQNQYSKRDYIEAGQWIMSADPATAEMRANEYGETDPYTLGQSFAAENPDYFDQIVKELRYER